MLDGCRHRKSLHRFARETARTRVSVGLSISAGARRAQACGRVPGPGAGGRLGAKAIAARVQDVHGAMAAGAGKGLGQDRRRLASECRRQPGSAPFPAPGEKTSKSESHRWVWSRRQVDSVREARYWHGKLPRRSIRHARPQLRGRDEPRSQTTSSCRCDPRLVEEDSAMIRDDGQSEMRLRG